MLSIPIEKNSNSSHKNLSKKSLSCLLHVPINLNDSISAMELFSNILTIGTNIGAVYIVYLNAVKQNQKAINHILKYSEENISSISFQSQTKVNIAIGDVEIKVIDLEKNINNLQLSSTSIKNYNDHKEHYRNCINTTCLLSSNNFLKVNTLFCQDNPLAKIKLSDTHYENKSLPSLEIKKGEIPMTNFSVPFDFDGDRFVFIDYISPETRRLCIYYTNTNCEPIIIELEKSFGHVSHIKLLPYYKLFIVRNKIQCEIREENLQFKIIESFVHIGVEVTASYIYNPFSLSQSKYIDDKEYSMREINEIDLNKKDNASNRSSHLSGGLSNSQKSLLKVETKGIVIHNELHKVNTYANNYHVHNVDSITVIPMLIDVEIGTLDENGNFNIYKNGQENFVFNLYKVNNIAAIFKEKEFFSSGVPYYICFNNKYYVISTDHGAFVIERK